MIITNVKCILQSYMSTIKTIDFLLELKFKNESLNLFFQKHP